MVGVDFPDINDVIIIGHPPNVNDYLQKIGRAGRDRTLILKPRGIMYITSHAMRSAHEKLGIELPTARPRGGQANPKPSNKPGVRRARKHNTSNVEALSASKSSMSVEMAQLIVPKCKTHKLDTMYGNPVLHPSALCNCSDCVPEPKVSKGHPQRRPKGEAHPKLTKEMKEHATKRLIRLREEIYVTADPKLLTDPFLVLPRFLPSKLVSGIIDTLLRLTWKTLNELIGENEIVKAHALKIWTVVFELQATFKQQLEQKVKKRCVSLVAPPRM